MLVYIPFLSFLPGGIFASPKELQKKNLVKLRTLDLSFGFPQKPTLLQFFVIIDSLANKLYICRIR